MMSCKTVLFTLLVVFSSVKTSAQTTQREYALKAGLIYNFARFSQTSILSSDNETQYRICSTSNEFSMVAKTTLNNKKIQQRSILVTYLTIEKLATQFCDVIFFEYIATYKRYILAKKHNTSNTILIGNFPDFIDLGGHINFIYISGKIRFEINPNKLKKNGIKMSSKVIRLGKIKSGEKL